MMTFLFWDSLFRVFSKAAVQTAVFDISRKANMQGWDVLKALNWIKNQIILPLYCILIWLKWFLPRHMLVQICISSS